MAPNAHAAYRTTYFEGMDPKSLILMLYDGAVKHLCLAREGILEKNIQKRGENLSQSIAIVNALNACLDSSINDEPIEFLRGLYTAILFELPKVSLTNDVKTLDTAIGYMNRLREIWKDNVMGRPRLTAVAAPDQVPPTPTGALGKTLNVNRHLGKSISA